METADFSIQTRQKADLLASTRVPLGIGGVYQSRVRRVEGYAQLEILGVSDQPFQIQVYQATDVNKLGVGHFVQTPSVIAAVLTGAQWVVCTRISPCGRFAYFSITNTGVAPMAELDFTVLGLPA